MSKEEKRDEKMLRRVRFDAQNLRASREEGTDLPAISGYAALFNVSTDLYYATESIAAGAFAQSIARGDDVRALFNHDPNLILGRTKAKTLELREDDKGLFIRILPPATQLGRDLVVSIERGDISQMSFGFYVDKEEREVKEDGSVHYTILSATLLDVSPVTFPAYKETQVEVERTKELRMADLERDRRYLARADLERRERDIARLKM